MHDITKNIPGEKIPFKNPKGWIIMAHRFHV
jgi:hypothetical protein